MSLVSSPIFVHVFEEEGIDFDHCQVMLWNKSKKIDSWNIEWAIELLCDRIIEEDLKDCYEIL